MTRYGQDRDARYDVTMSWALGGQAVLYNRGLLLGIEMDSTIEGGYFLLSLNILTHDLFDTCK